METKLIVSWLYDKAARAHDHSYARMLNMTAKRLRELDEKQRWIPVTERLPDIPDGWAEHPDPVLYMMASTRSIHAGYYGENGTYRDKYFREYHDRYEGVDADDVLCWMWQHDLPKPPKEVDHESET